MRRVLKYLDLYKDYFVCQKYKFNALYYINRYKLWSCGKIIQLLFFINTAS